MKGNREVAGALGAQVLGWGRTDADLGAVRTDLKGGTSSRVPGRKVLTARMIMELYRTTPGNDSTFEADGAKT
jgi:hypothetical protein